MCSTDQRTDCRVASDNDDDCKLIDNERPPMETLPQTDTLRRFTQSGDLRLTEIRPRNSQVLEREKYLLNLFLASDPYFT